MKPEDIGEKMDVEHAMQNGGKQMSKKEAVEKIDGVVSKIGCSVSRKVSDGAYGSFEVSKWVEVDLSPTANVEEEMIALDTYLTAAVGASAKDKQDKIAKPVEEPTVPMVPLAPPAAEGHCAIHNVPMKQYTKEGRSWYSHKVGDAWCKGV